MTTRFIHRPVLSIVVSIIIFLLGLLTLTQLPMTLFPSIAPPEVNVEVEYTGANAETVTKSAIVPLERAINGVPGMKYMSSDAGNDGVGVIQILFEAGTDPNIAAINVQTRVNDVIAELPAEVIKAGLAIAKEENAMLMYLNIFSSDTTMDEKFLYNYADINILAELKRIKGVGHINIMGAKEYAMRIWLKPDKMVAYNVSTEEVLNALTEQNIEAAPGKIGESSDKKGQALQYTVKYTGKFNTEKEYENIPIKAVVTGKILKIKDIADVEFGTSYFDVEAKLNGKPCAALQLKQLPGTNASEVIVEVKKRLAELKETMFLPGMGYELSYDVSRFLDASVHEVYRTLIEAFLLVALVVFIFLQDWRSTVIPAIAVPVSLVGTFFFIQFLGFSLNLITLFALVLAIGIVVDNAIVVVEAVHAKMEHSKMGPLKATEQAMKEISGAIIAITLVMSAVFIPVAFMSGPSGIFYRQFSLTMAISIVLSGIVALTLTPALCAIILINPHNKKYHKSRLAKLFDGFNRWYHRVEDRYKRLLELIVNRRTVTFGVLIIFCLGTGILGKLLPSGFIPNEDQGTFYASITTPSGATLERTKSVVDEIQKSSGGISAIESISTLAGTNVLSDGTGATYGTVLINLKPWEERTESIDDIIEILKERTTHIKDATIEFFPPPAVPGYGNASGFELRLLDKTGNGDFKAMEEVVKQFIADLKAHPQIASAFTIFDASYPQYLLRVDMDKAAQKCVTVNNAMSSLQTLMGSEYATNFIRFGQMYKVMVQASPEYRALPEDLLKLYVKNDLDEMVPLSAFMTVEKTYGVDQITRYNMFPSAELNGEGKPGVSSGSVLKAIQETAKEKLPRGFDIDWAGISRDEVSAGNEGIFIFLICLVFVYLLLAGQYESFLLPLPVILSLPTGIFGAFLLLGILELENNIYAQVAMIMLIGLLGKNAILIVEFATQKHREGKTPVQAAIEGARVRLRPILMTSFAFIAGLLPLVIATGAGAVGNRTIGTAALGGMLFGTLFGVIIIPGLYVVFATIAEKFNRGRTKEELAFTEPFDPMKYNSPIIIFIAIGALTVGCKPLPVTKVKEKPTPSSFIDNQDTVNIANVDWREFFPDKNLVALIDSALVNNFDALIAMQRIEAAKAGVQFNKGALLPTVGVMAVPAVRRYGLYTMDGAGNITTDILPGKIVPLNLPDFLVGLNTTWEADIAGKLRNRKKAAVARYLATVEGKNWVITNLVADVAMNYYELLALDYELEIIREAITLQENALNIVTIQKQVGAANELAVQQFKAQLLNTKAMEQEVLQVIVQNENEVNILLGRYPQYVIRDKAILQENVPAVVQAGVPSDLLRNRPDIKRAELELMASKADVRAARAAFFPSFFITGTTGFQAFRTNLLFNTPESFIFTLVGGLSAPLITRHAIKAEFTAATAFQVETIYNYQRSVLQAYVEVYNEISNLNNLQRVYTLRDEEVNTLTQAIQTSTELFRAGRATYLEVLVTQQNLLDARLDFIGVKRGQLLATVNLYKALGGGWR